jgi:hypothetical protein
VSARAEVVTPRRDLVSSDFEDAHAGASNFLPLMMKRSTRSVSTTLPATAMFILTPFAKDGNAEVVNERARWAAVGPREVANKGRTTTTGERRVIVVEAPRRLADRAELPHAGHSGDERIDGLGRRGDLDRVGVAVLREIHGGGA